jgi:hypothetical protein
MASYLSGVQIMHAFSLPHKGGFEQRTLKMLSATVTLLSFFA